MARKALPVEVGDVFVSRAMPQREWRVRERDDDSVTLERRDHPNALRFVEIRELLDSNRYVRKQR